VNEDRSASFVELLFDLVFVFAITRVVASIHGHLGWPTLWRAAGSARFAVVGVDAIHVDCRLRRF
jgi:low temperature requirement protein LtrA